TVAWLPAHHMAQHRLARQAQQPWQSLHLDLIEAPQHGVVLPSGLAETESRVEHNATRIYAGLLHCPHPLAEKLPDIAHHVTVPGRQLHGTWIALHVHDAQAAIAPRHSLDRNRFLEPAYIVDHV